MKTIHYLILIAAISFLALGLTGCGIMGVKPWQHEVLAKPEMQFDGHGNDQAIDDHIYFSKEAASGGRGFGGGGCGCN